MNGIGIDYSSPLTGEFNINGSYKTIRKIQILEKNKIFFVTLTYDGNDVKLYVNGIYTDKIHTSGKIKLSNNVMALGEAINGDLPSGNHYFKGKIYSAKVYNRALSEDEIHHNYILEKNRYGIEE